MPDALAGKDAVFSVSADDITYSVVNGIDDATLSKMRERLESTAFGDQAKNAVAGIKDGNIPFSGFYLPSDAGQVLIRTKEDTGALFYGKLLFDGVNGFKSAVKIFKFDVKESAVGRVDFSGELSFVGVPTAIP